MPPLRIAFLTPEFPTELPNAGGLGVYVSRISRSLTNLGHRVEVFTLTDKTPRTVDFGGIDLHLVLPPPHHCLGLVARASCRFSRLVAPASTKVLAAAWALARAFHTREAVVPFAFAQSTDYGSTGLFVSRRRSRPHLVRCSWSGEIFQTFDGVPRTFDTALVWWLEQRCVRRADIAYAPSRSLADLLSRRLGIQVLCLRPPMFLDTAPAEELPMLPPRFLVHFGQICARKGSDVLAEALPVAWREEPAIEMVWCGREIAAGTFDSFTRKWGRQATQVTWLGALPRPQLYGVVQRATAAVLPSRLDNLPNTALESLLLGVPVIGSRGASIEEIIDDGGNGMLVPVGDHLALAAALVRVWRSQLDFQRRGLADGLQAEMEPSQAARALVRLAGCHD